MKKFILSLIAIAFTICVSAQSTVPRYGITKNADNTGRALKYGYLTPAKTLTMSIAPNYYNTLISVPSLTISPTYSFIASNGYTADQVTIISSASAASRTITLLGAVNVYNDTMVITSGKKGVLTLMFDGTKYVEVSRTVEP